MKKHKTSPLDIPAGLMFLSYLLEGVIALVGFGILWYFGREYILVDVRRYIKFDATGLFVPPTLIFFGCAALWAIISGRSYSHESKPVLVGRALWLSANAGFWEELLYRGLVFMSAMVLIPLSNFLLLGFAGLNIVNWLYQSISVPVSNFFTLGLMHAHIFTNPWVVGAALVSAAGKFSDAHAYLGLIGRINSWFAGVFLFWIMFNYGMITGMVIHFIYDATILVVAALRPKNVGISWLR
ncbi:hypothetical protein EOM33_07210 [Candidatus Saccharibacteria bacterium]|jgi:hypothetical protein|nr:hypothetical protein [Candidatus Saccharibacteria bacterium]